VIYNNNTYVSRSTTVVQNIHNTRINNVGNVTNIANNPHFEPRRPDFPQQGGDPRPGDPRSGDPRSGDPRSGGMAAAALAGAAGMARAPPAVEARQRPQYCPTWNTLARHCRPLSRPSMTRSTCASAALSGTGSGSTVRR